MHQGGENGHNFKEKQREALLPTGGISPDGRSSGQGLRDREAGRPEEFGNEERVTLLSDIRGGEKILVSKFIWCLYILSICLVGCIFDEGTRTVGLIACSYFVFFTAMVGVAFIHDKKKHR